MFRKKRGIRLNYNKQGLIHFTCLDWKSQPKEIQDKIFDLCQDIGREDAQALEEIVTTEKSIVEISLKYHLNEKYLYKMRKLFYERW